MEFLLSLPKLLLDLCVNLLKIRSDDNTKQRLAEVLDDVATCVSNIADNVFEEVHDEELCAELDVYIERLRGLVEKHVDSETADKLTFWLNHVAEVPGYCKIQYGKVIVHEVEPEKGHDERFRQGQNIKSTAGTIKGISNLLKV